MIPWLTTGKFLNGLIAYNEDKKHSQNASLIHVNTFDESIETFKFLYREMTENKRDVHNLMHISLNFHSDDREQLTTEFYKTVTEDFLLQFGYPLDQPYLIYEHRDKNHPHIHIAVPMALTSGEWIDNRNFPARRMIKIARGIEKKYGLKQVTENPIEAQKFAERGRVYETSKQAITEVVGKIMSERPANLQEAEKIATRYTVEYNGHQSTVAFEVSAKKNGLTVYLKDAEGHQISKGIKGSNIPGNFSMGRMNEKFQVNSQTKEARAGKIKALINRTLSDGKQTLSQFKNSLLAEKVIANEYYTKTGDVFGIDFTDEVSGIRFKASDLDKNLSWNKLKNAIIPDTNTDQTSIQETELYTPEMAKSDIIQQLKSRVSLVDLIERHGYSYNKQKSTAKAKVFEGNDILIVYNNASDSDISGLYYKTANNDLDKGDIINFMINKGLAGSFSEAIKALNTSSDFISPTTAKSIYKETVPVYEDQKEFKAVRMDDYTNADFLIVDRGIDIRIIDQHFNGAVFTTTHEHLYEDLKAIYGNVVHKYLEKEIKPQSNYTVFPIYEFTTDKMVGQQIRHKDFDHLVSGSDKTNGIWHKYDATKPEISIFENPIDNISYINLYPEIANISSPFATIGNPSGKIVESIAELSKKHKANLCGDADEAGQYFNTRFLAKIISQQNGVEISTVRSKQLFKWTFRSSEKSLINHLRQVANSIGSSPLFDVKVEPTPEAVSIVLNKKNPDYDYATQLAFLNQNIAYFYQPNVKIVSSTLKDFNEELQAKQRGNNIKPSLQ